MSEEKIWTLLELIQWTTNYFHNKGIENPRLNVETLLGKALNMERVDLYVNYDRIINPGERQIFKQLIQRRLQGEPLQYILGETGFYGLNIRVTPDVLIPRPETELLVETALELISPNIETVADLGTGSGCIALALAANHPNLTIIATDISEAALSVARQNAIDLHLENRVTFYQQDMVRDILPEGFKVDMVISNPPYIPDAEFAELSREVKEFEPDIALTDHGDGLTYYRAILEKARTHFHHSNGIVLLELGYGQADAVEKLARSLGYQNIVIKKDYANINRIFKANYGN